MEEQPEITHTQIEVARIERDSGIYTPSFISDLPVIDKTEAAEFAFKNNLLPDSTWIKKSPKDTQDYYARKATLAYCRVRGITIAEAEEVIKNDKEYSILDLHQMFSVKNEATHHKETVELERERRKTRDQEILRLEKSFLTKQGFHFTKEMPTLLDYCTQLANEKNMIYETDYKGEEVYWDLMEHYSMIMEAAQRGFEPLNEWKQYLAGDLDIKDSEVWDIQNVGSDDLSYYDMARKWTAPRTRPNRTSYDSNLLFHATNLDAANNIVKSGYLHPRVCTSAGQVLTGRYDLAFIFRKEDIVDNYSALPYIEEMSSHEREIRSNEMISLDFCIGCVPVTEGVFSDKYKESWYYPEQPAGRIVSERWEKNLKETGELWTESDRKTIEEEIKKVQDKKA